MPHSPNTTLLNRYRIERLLGQGTFAEVYLVTHLKLNAPYALKVLRKDAPGLGSTEFGDYRQRFELEAQFGVMLKNQNIIQAHDLEEDAETETLYLRMTYAPGGNLAEKLAAYKQRGELMPVEEAVQITLEVAQGLAALHEMDAVHRDVKPSNILFDEKGKALLADLGLAQIPGGASQRSTFSRGKPQPGTPDYMSPEQGSSYASLTPASDSYAMGLVLFEMLTSQRYQSFRPGISVQNIRGDVPDWVTTLLGAMLAHDPSERPWNGAELIAALNNGQIMGETFAAAVPDHGHLNSEPTRIVRWRAVRPWLIIGMVAIIASGVLWLVVNFGFGGTTGPANTGESAPVTVELPATAEEISVPTSTTTSTWTPLPTHTFTPNATKGTDTISTSASTHTLTKTTTHTPAPSATATTGAVSTQIVAAVNATLTSAAELPNPTSTNKPPATDTPIPANVYAVDYSTPQLLSPADGSRFSSQEKVEFRWQGSPPLGPDVLYLLVVQHERGASWIVTDATSWTAPNWLPDYQPVKWYVTRCNKGKRGEYSSKPCEISGPRSLERTVEWETPSSSVDVSPTQPTPTNPPVSGTALQSDAEDARDLSQVDYIVLAGFLGLLANAYPTLRKRFYL